MNRRLGQGCPGLFFSVSIPDKSMKGLYRKSEPERHYIELPSCY